MIFRTQGYIQSLGTMTYCKGQLANKMCQTGFVVAGGRFFPIATINLLSLKRIRDSGYCSYEMREINTFKNCPYESFLER